MGTRPARCQLLRVPASSCSANRYLPEPGGPDRPDDPARRAGASAANALREADRQVADMGGASRPRTVGLMELSQSTLRRWMRRFVSIVMP